MSRTSSKLAICCFRHRMITWIMLVAFCGSFLPSVSLAQQPTATISALNGTVLVNGQIATAGAVLSAGDVVETQAGASLVLTLSDGSTLELGESSKLDISILSQTATGARTSQVKLWWGRVRARLSGEHQQVGSSFDIETPNALVGVKFSQPDVEVIYEPVEEKTTALAHTVALWVTNLLTQEQVLVPVGSTVIITALGFQIIAGISATGAVMTETAATGTASTGGATGTATGIGTGTMVAIGAGAVAAVGGVTVIAASSGDESDGIASVVSSVEAFCIRFQANDDYWVEAYIIDPGAIVASAAISGSHGASSLTYNLSSRHPGWWWTDPNIFISQGVSPVFPLSYTVHIIFKDGTIRDVSRVVRTCEWCTENCP